MRRQTYTLSAVNADSESERREKYWVIRGLLFVCLQVFIFKVTY